MSQAASPLALKTTPKLQDVSLGKIALVQFLAIKDQDAFHPYISASEHYVGESGGQRTHSV